MRKVLANPSVIKWFSLLSILALTILLGTTSSRAQDLTNWDINAILPGIAPTPGSLFTYLDGEANSPQGGRLVEVPGTGQLSENLTGELNSGVPDLVISDPKADVPAEIEAFINAAVGESLVIPAADFVPDSNSRTWFFGFNSSYIYPNSASGYCGIAPLYLPQGATLTSMAAYVYDNDASFNVLVYLYPKELGTTTTATQSAQVMSTGQSTALQVLVDTTISPAVIDNENYTYHLAVCMPGADNNSRFYAVQVYYTH